MELAEVVGFDIQLAVGEFEFGTSDRLAGVIPIDTGCYAASGNCQGYLTRVNETAVCLVI